jgi:hypothetical protein
MPNRGWLSLKTCMMVLGRGMGGDVLLTNIHVNGEYKQYYCKILEPTKNTELCNTPSYKFLLKKYVHIWSGHGGTKRPKS